MFNSIDFSFSPKPSALPPLCSYIENTAACRGPIVSDLYINLVHGSLGRDFVLFILSFRRWLLFVVGSVTHHQNTFLRAVQ